MSVKKESVLINGTKRKLIYLSQSSYDELFNSVEQFATKLILKSKGQDETMRVVYYEMKCFLFNDFVFTTESNCTIS